MTIAANAAETDALRFLDSLARVRVSCEQGEGHVSVIELTAPRGSMPPLHVTTRTRRSTSSRAGGPSTRVRPS